MKKSVFWRTAALAIGLLAAITLMYVRNCQASDSLQPLLITEIMYDPEGPDDKKEWMEFFNASDGESTVASIGKSKEIYTLPLRVCTAFDESQDTCIKSYPVYFDKETLTISGETFFIITSYKETFLRDHPEFPGIVLESKCILNNKTEGNFVGLFFEDRETGTIEWLDSVHYFPEWGAKGDNRTLERKDYSLPNFRENWAVSRQTGGTPGESFQQDIIDIVYSDKIRINELVPDPVEGMEEAIELFNPESENAVSLDGWTVQDKSGKTYKIKDTTLDAGGYKILNSTGISLNNDGDEIVLINPDGKVVDSVVYGISKGKGWSWARKSEGIFDWTPIITLGKENEFPIKVEYPDKISFNEFFPNPEGPDKGNEWIEFRNLNNSKISLSGWTLINSSGKKYNIDGLTLPASSFGVLNFHNSAFAIGNSDEYLILLNPDQIEVDRAEFAVNAKESLSYNLAPDGEWRWSRFLTPGKENRFNQPPKIKIKKMDGLYVNSPIMFDAAGTVDHDKDKLKFVWDFDDGQRSSLARVEHTFRKKGDYKVKLTVSDGSEEVIKELKLKVKDHPKRKLEIVRLVPNPAGLDGEGGEIVVIYNREQKEVCLSGYSIATGSVKSKLAKHAIDNVCIKKNKTYTITKQDSAFSLTNSFGRVDILYPDGKIADSVTYGKKKILEDESYVKMSGVWRWQASASAKTSGTESSDEKETFDARQKPAISEERIIATEDNKKETDNNANQEETAEVKSAIQNIFMNQRQTVRQFNISDWLPSSEPWLRFLPSFTNNDQGID